VYYVGLDAHAKSYNGHILDCNGKRINRFEVRGSRAALVEELRKIPGPFAVCFEASCGYGALHEELSKWAVTVKVANAGKTHLIFRSKRKNNRVDAEHLAKLLYLDEVPAVHVPDRDVRAWRKTIEFRQRLLAERVRVKNRIRALLREQGICPPRALWSGKGIAWLEALALDEASALQRDLLVADLKEAAAKVARVDKYLKTISDKHPGVSLLRTIPGVGPRTAEALVAYVDDIRRFGRVKSVACYFGLVPCQDASGDVNRLGHITGDGPATVRKLLCEAAWTAVRSNATVRAYFERVMRNDPQRKKIAIVATAHYLVRVAAALLRSGECWRDAGTSATAEMNKSCPPGIAATTELPGNNAGSQTPAGLPPSWPPSYAAPQGVKVPPHEYMGPPPAGRSTLTPCGSAENTGHEGGRTKTGRRR
jgi:transposase